MILVAEKAVSRRPRDDSSSGEIALSFGAHASLVKGDCLMKKAVLVLGLAVLGVGACTLVVADDERKGLKEVMQRKLKHSQKVLEGVAVKDFDLIVNNAEELVQVSKTAEWKVFKTAQYERYSNELRRNAETLIEQAKGKNLDGAALAYVDITLTCVKCHKHVREKTHDPPG
jgi:hypothetical protein